MKPEQQNDVNQKTQETVTPAIPDKPENKTENNMVGRIFIIFSIGNGILYGLFIINYVILTIFSPYQTNNTQGAIPFFILVKFIIFLNLLTQVLPPLSFFNIIFYSLCLIIKDLQKIQKIVSITYIVLSLILLLYVYSFYSDIPIFTKTHPVPGNIKSGTTTEINSQVKTSTYQFNGGLSGSVISTEKTGFFSEIFVSISLVTQVDRKAGTISGNQLSIDADTTATGNLGNAISDPVQNQVNQFHLSHLDPKQMYMLTATGSTNNAGYTGVITQCSGYIVQEYCVIPVGGLVTFLFNGTNKIPQPQDASERPSIPTPPPPLVPGNL